jgi:DNA replication protein DnaC
MVAEEPLPPCILEAQAAFERRQAAKAAAPPIQITAAALTQERDHAARREEPGRVIISEGAIERLLQVFKVVEDVIECPAHPGQTAVYQPAATRKANAAVYRCPVCIEEHNRKPEVCQSRIAAAGIPRDVWHATLANFDTERQGVKQGGGYSSPAKFLEAARRLHASQIRNLILGGTPGIGKGHLAAAIAIDRLDHGWPVAWTTCGKLFAAVHDTYDGGPTREGVLYPCIRANLLVLDEIGMRDLPKDGEEILFDILTPRKEAGLQTILLGNLPLKGPRDTSGKLLSPGVHEWLGERLCDRLRSGGVAFCYGEWESMRGQDGDGGQANEF